MCTDRQAGMKEGNECRHQMIGCPLLVIRGVCNTLAESIATVSLLKMLFDFTSHGHRLVALARQLS